ncbi:MAG: LCP family protein [Pseudanabaenaceae cyanobacterium]
MTANIFKGMPVKDAGQGIPWQERRQKKTEASRAKQAERSVRSVAIERTGGAWWQRKRAWWRQTRRRMPPYVWGTLLFLAIAGVSGGLGAALAVVFTGKPLQRRVPTAAESEIFGQNPANIAAATLGLPSLTRPVHVLVLGTVVLSVDLPGATTPPPGQPFAHVEGNLEGLSDAILLLRFDPRVKKVTALSIPRDSRVDIPGYGIGKINSANYFGGAALAALTVSQTLGNVPIDRYVRLNVNGFGELIDALGGVEVVVPKPLKYRDDSQRLYIDLPAGRQKLDGAKAIQYMRYRDAEYGDVGRVQRQQALLRALKEQKLNVGTLTRLPEILRVLRNNIDTNLSINEMLALGGFAADLDRSQFDLLLLPGRFSEAGEFPLSYWLLAPEQIRPMMAAHFGLPMSAREAIALSPNELQISVQDTVGSDDGLVAARQILQEAGYPNLQTVDPLPMPLPQTQIVAQNGNRLLAAKIRDLLGLGEVTVEATGDLRSDVTIRLGQDWTNRQRVKKAAPGH